MIDTSPHAHLNLASKCIMASQSKMHREEQTQKYYPSHGE